MMWSPAMVYTKIWHNAATRVLCHIPKDLAL